MPAQGSQPRWPLEIGPGSTCRSLSLPEQNSWRERLAWSAEEVQVREDWPTGLEWGHWIREAGQMEYRPAPVAFDEEEERYRRLHLPATGRWNGGIGRGPIWAILRQVEVEPVMDGQPSGDRGSLISIGHSEQAVTVPGSRPMHQDWAPPAEYDRGLRGGWSSGPMHSRQNCPALMKEAWRLTVRSWGRVDLWAPTVRMMAFPAVSRRGARDPEPFSAQGLGGSSRAPGGRPSVRVSSSSGEESMVAP